MIGAMTATDPAAVAIRKAGRRMKRLTAQLKEARKELVKAVAQGLDKGPAELAELTGLSRAHMIAIKAGLRNGTVDDGPGR